MADDKFTTADKISVIEAGIDFYRPSRRNKGSPEYRAFCVLKAIADDYRGRQEGEPLAAAYALQQVIAAANTARAHWGKISDGHCRRIAEELIGRWHVVSQALERSEAETTK